MTMTMTVTTITSGRPRMPALAALAVGAALVAGGAIGVAWDQHDETPAATHAHAPTADLFAGATTSDELSGAVPATGSPGGATTSDELSGSTSGSIPATGSPGGATTSQESTR
jgi:hypothetical protein